MELLFDFVSKNISPSEIAAFSACTSEQANINTSLIEKYPHEYCFRALIHWKRSKPKINHRNHLIGYFKTSDDHKQLAHRIESFSMDDYVYTSGEIKRPEEPVTNDDRNFLKNHLGPEYCHVVRFLGMTHRTFVQICEDNRDLKSRIFTALLSIQQLTRQKLCNALCYADRRDIIETLNESWKKI